MNRTLKDQLAKFVQDTNEEWDRLLSCIELAYNSTVNSSTGFSPFYLVHGREPNLPVTLSVSNDNSCTTTPSMYANLLYSRLCHAFNIVRNNLLQAQDNQSYYHDRTSRFEPYEPGDLVWVTNAAQSRNKLAPKWIGPFTVLESLNDGITYKVIRRGPAAHPQVLHYNRLKPYRQQELGPETPTSTRSDLTQSEGGPVVPEYSALSGSLPLTPQPVQPLPIASATEAPHHFPPPPGSTSRHGRKHIPNRKYFNPDFVN
ncbi:hypothetical protein HOLleu_16220 [Holothuria leucospilota]|uniref:Integrase catalytic domain-containing protein n=1 Tax=Holothuria leucospilota TaxID=206669 RepID=A0A9Q1C4Y1_HOLLE|nr:hypothetical protein HOLleu_16220 [Holothuria leucospilota]